MRRLWLWLRVWYALSQLRRAEWATKRLDKRLSRAERIYRG